MAWTSCSICSNERSSAEKGVMRNSTQKVVDYHEKSTNRNFRITIIMKCPVEKEENEEIGGLEEEAPEKPQISSNPVNFFVDLAELVKICPYFQKYEKLDFLEFTSVCDSTWISAPEEVAERYEDCCHRVTSSLVPGNFHAFLEAACPSMYGIRPVPVDIHSIVPVLAVLSHFHSEPLLTNCERFLMSINFGQLEGNVLIKLLDKGLGVTMDHRILGRIVCVCLMNTTSKLGDFSQDLVGNVGAVFAQAFVANASKSFRHVKPLEQETNRWPAAVRHLMLPPSTSSEFLQGATNSEEGCKKKQKRQGCDHNEESFECILCFDQRCGKCRGESAFCYKALDNFLYEIRLQLYPHTYRPHLDRDMLREDRINDYIMRHQFQPLPQN